MGKATWSRAPWHRTSLPSLEGILRDGEIVPNKGQLHTTSAQSKVSYAWHLNAVSLFDFDTADQSSVSEHGWRVVFTSKLPAVVLIRIRREALDRTKLLLPTEILRGDPRMVIIPAVEALHIGPISASAFSGFIFTALEKHGGYLWIDLPFGV